MPSTPSPLFEVRLLDLPLAVHERSRAHLDDLQREFALIVHGDHANDSVPSRVWELATSLQVRFDGLGADENAAIAAAAARGEESIDITYHVPAAWAEACVHILRMLDEVDDYCRDIKLLTLETPAEGVHYRRWVFGEFIRQVAGDPPLRWPDYLRDHADADAARR